jgi:hypothetical protein
VLDEVADVGQLNVLVRHCDLQLVGAQPVAQLDEVLFVDVAVRKEQLEHVETVCVPLHVLVGQDLADADMGGQLKVALSKLLKELRALVGGVELN